MKVVAFNCILLFFVVVSRRYIFLSSIVVLTQSGNFFGCTTIAFSERHVPILSQINPTQPFHFISLKIDALLLFHLCVGLSSGLFPSGVANKNRFCMLSHTCHMPHPSSLNLLPCLVTCTGSFRPVTFCLVTSLSRSLFCEHVIVME